MSSKKRFDKGILSFYDSNLVIEPKDTVIELIDQEEHENRNVEALCDILGVEPPIKPKERESEITVNIEID